MNFFKNLLLVVRSKKLAVGSQRGGTEIFIVVIVVLIAFLLAGGEFLLGSAFPLPDSLGIGGGTGNPSGTPGGTNPSADWELTLEDRGCNTVSNQAVYTLGAFGPTRGYFTLSVKNGEEFTPILSELFSTPPNQSWTLELGNAQGFNKNPWKVELFDVNPTSPETVTGGALKTSRDGSPTGC